MTSVESALIAYGPGWEMRATNSGARVLTLKRHDASVAEATSLARCHRELELLRFLDGPFTPRAYELTSADGRPALVLQDLTGFRSLADLTRETGQWELARVLTIAASIATALGELHHRDVIHRALRPEHVLVRGDETLLIGFEQATRMAEAEPHNGSALLDLPALTYASPEQTGRMNRPVDYRTDLYSLGVVLYELLAGVAPFAGRDVVGTMHAHIAITPARLRSHRPNLPVAIEVVVAKLLAKAPDARYQNAFSVAADLRRIREALAQGEELAVAELGRNDRSGRFVFAQRLYGRDTAAVELMRIFDRVARGGREVLFLAGYAGVGKTALVNETQRLLAQHHGEFVSGKFDQLERITPFSAVRRAFADLLQRLADAPAATRDVIARELSAVLGPSINVLLDLMPELALLVDPPEIEVEFSTADANDRFRLAFRKLVAALARKHHPLVLVLDDLQWIDTPSLRLVEDLCTAEEISHLLVIGSYRDNEIDAGHPLVTTLRRLEDSRAPVTSMTLTALESGEVEALIADSFPSDEGFAAALAERVHAQTGGNPLFVRRLLRSLYDERLLRFDFRSSSWTCDVDSVARFDDSPNVVELMVRQLRKLDDEVVHVLGLAACIGDTFDVETLAGLAALPAHVVQDRLWRAAQARMLSLLSGHEWTELGAPGHALVDAHARELVYRFRHDRVQQAAYTLLGPERLPSIHLAICRLLRARGTEHGFDSAGHCIRAISVIDDRQEKREVLALLVHSAGRAIAVNAASAAEEYCRTVLSVVDAGDDREGELARKARQLLGESQALLGDFEGARRTFEQALAAATSKLERVAILALMMEIWVSQGCLDLALSTLIEILAMFGIELDEHNVAEVAARAFEQVERARAGRSTQEIVEAPETDDPEVVALLDVLARAADTVYMNGRDWVVAVAAVAVTTVLERGTSIAASMIFSTYAVADAEPHTAEGFARRAEYGRIGVALADRFGSASWIARANVSNVHHFDRPFREAIAGYGRAAAIGWDSSALTWAAYAEVRVLFCMLVAGVDLDTIDRERLERVARIRRANRAVSEVCCDALELFVRSLRERTEEPWLLGGSSEAASALDARLQTSGPWAACKALALEMLLAIVYQRWAEAEATVRAIEPIGHALHGMTHEHWFHVLDVVRLVNEVDAADEAARSRATARAREAERFLEARVGLSRDYEAGLHVVRAARATLEGDDHRAIEELNRAIEFARDCEQLPMLAIASEEAHRVAARRGWKSLAQFYLGEAHAAYLAWGATAKAAELAAKLPARPELSERIAVADVESLLKSVRAISGELRTTPLLRRLVHILLENAGAQRGLIVLVRDGAPRVEAVGEVSGSDVEVELPGEPIDEQDLAFYLVHRVLRTRETVVLDDVESQTDFSLRLAPDTRRPRSTLTMPLESRGRCIGALHLESWEATHAFRSDARRMLWLLMSQAVTALDNARLYGNLEREIEERTRTEVALREQRDYSARVLESLPLLACGVEADGTLAFVNPSVERATGLDKQALVGRSFWSTLHSREQEREALRQRLAREGQVRAHETTLEASGQARVISWTCVRGGVHRSQVLCFGEDVTEERQHEQDRAALEERLRRSQKLETLGTLASGIAHDFNNILVPITAYAELLGRELEPDSDAREHVAEITGAATRAADLVRQILAASRKTDRVRQPVLLQNVAAEVGRLLEASLGARVEIRTSIEPNCPAIASDPGQIHQALLNLGTNAGQAMQPDGGVLELGVARARFPASSARAGEPCVRVTVSDTGHGMDEATRARIFDPFFTTKPLGQGTGLGLWVVHGVVDNAGGSIDVTSEVGKGTTFSIDFPIAEHCEPTSPRGQTNRPARGHERLLVVDDEPVIARVVARALTMLGYRVLPLTNPREALEVFQGAPHEFDAVLTDLTMPELDGLRLAEQIHAIRPDVPIVLTSGLPPDEPPDALGARGILAVVPKPLSLDRLGVVIRELLDPKSN